MGKDASPSRNPGPHSLPPCEPGRGLVDAVGLPEARLNLLFAALLTTAGGCFIAGNLLLSDPLVLQRSGGIGLACLALLLIFYPLARWLGSLTWGLVLTYGLLLVMTYARQPWLVGLVYGCAACGFLYALRFLRIARRHSGSVLLMGVIGTAATFAHYWPLTSFDMLQRLHGGDLYKEALYTAAVAAMIKNYGVVSTGLHGLVETPYHALSHALMAGLSRLSGRGTLEVYGVARQVLFVPLLIFGTVACCAMLDRGGRVSLPLVWGLACILLVGLPLLLLPWLFWWLYFGSESYLVSLGPFLLGLPLLFKARLRPPDLLLVPAVAALTAGAKLSVGLIYAGLWLTRSLFVREERPLPARIATLAVVVAVAVVTLEPIAARTGTLALDPLHFIRAYSLFGSRLLAAGTALLAGEGLSWGVLALALLAVLGFFVFHFLPSWVLLGWVVYRRGLAALLMEPAALYSVAAVGAGALVVLLFSILHGSAYYFSNVAFFVALPVILLLLGHGLGHRRVTGTRVLVFGSVVILGVGLKDYSLASAFSPLRAPAPPSPFIASLLQVRDTLPLGVVMQADPAAVMRDNPLADRAHCSALPFLFPAVSERPWIGVFPAGDDCRYYGSYGYEQYGITATRQTVTVEPRLLPGMTIHHWPLAPRGQPPASVRDKVQE